MKRYILFRFSNFYPSGGMNDVEGHYDTLEEATDYVNECKEDDDWAEHYHVLDTVTRLTTHL
jgi:hypothetical protein